MFDNNNECATTAVATPQADNVAPPTPSDMEAARRAAARMPTVSGVPHQSRDILFARLKMAKAYVATLHNISAKHTDVPMLQRSAENAAINVLETEMKVGALGKAHQAAEDKVARLLIEVDEAIEERDLAKQIWEAAVANMDDLIADERAAKSVAEIAAEQKPMGSAGAAAAASADAKAEAEAVYDELHEAEANVRAIEKMLKDMDVGGGVDTHPTDGKKEDND